MTYAEFRVGIGLLASVLTLPASSFAATAAANQQVTFAKDVAPIFQEKCETCHRGGQGAPMSLQTYEEVRPWAQSIKQRVATKNMPPWHLDKTAGIQQYANDRSLSDKQIKTILKWVDEGAPLGDKKDLPAPKAWPAGSGWQYARIIGKEPDFVVKSSDWTVPAIGQDEWWRPVSDVPVNEERWIRAVEMRTGSVAGRKITHHATAQLEQFEPPSDQEIGSGGPGLLMEWAIGKNYDAFRPGSGRLILPGAKIRWDIHYHSVGERITDHIELAVYLYPKDQKPAHRTRLELLSAFPSNNDLDIPPNSIFSTQGLHVLRSAARLENFQPHMHLRGKGMSMEAIFPDGTIRMLSSVDRFNFNWMNNYIYTDDSAPVLPKGTILRITARYDNTTSNKDNPDPNQWVGYGDRTIEEMGHAWVNFTNLSDQEYAEWLARHKSVSTTAYTPTLSPGTPFRQVPIERPHEREQSVTPSYEGWWQNPDGTYNLMFGYFNRNTEESLDIPIGPNNHIDPGPPDQGQPTHFLPRRQKGVFTVTVPKNFGDRRITWTIVANGQTLAVPGHLGAAWIINPMSEIGIGNTPPTISFDEKGPSIQGPKPLIVERMAKRGEPLNLPVFAADDGKSMDIKFFRVILEVILNRQKARAEGATLASAVPATGYDPKDSVIDSQRLVAAYSREIARLKAEDAALATPELVAAASAVGLDADTIALYMRGSAVTLTWQKYRGPGEVIFADGQPKVNEVPGSEIPIKNVFNGKGTTTATFSEPGEYTLRVIANDSSGPEGGDFICCWTNGEIDVKVE